MLLPLCVVTTTHAGRGNLVLTEHAAVRVAFAAMVSNLCLKMHSIEDLLLVFVTQDFLQELRTVAPAVCLTATLSLNAAKTQAQQAKPVH